MGVIKRLLPYLTDGSATIGNSIAGVAIIAKSILIIIVKNTLLKKTITIKKREEIEEK
jgi:hypothetical protein